MRRSLNSASRFFALFAIAALAACSGNSTTIPPSPGSPASMRAFGVHSVVVTVVNGNAKLAHIPTILYLCTDKPFCENRNKTLSHGNTNKSGRVTLKGSFGDADVVCVSADWNRGNSSSTRGKCQNHFPNAITLRF